MTVAPDGSRVLFLRSASGTDPVNALWEFEVESGTERCLADPRKLLGTESESLTAEELALRQRMRQVGSGIVAYGVDSAATKATFALGSRLYVADLIAGGAAELCEVAGPVMGPRIDPTGSRIAYLAERGLHLVEATGGASRLLVGEDDQSVIWGEAEFVAAEEMQRFRGFWWAPDGRRLLATRVDESPVQRWYISDPAHPDHEPQGIRYPAAGTPNALVTISVVDLEGARVDVDWDTEALPYLARAGWPKGRSPFLVVQSRDQRRLVLLEVDVESGATTPVLEETDVDWVDIQSGVPAWLEDGRLVWLTNDEDTARLRVGDEWATPVGLQVSSVLGSGDDWVLLAASEEPTERHLFRWSDASGLERLTTAQGVHGGAAGGDVLVVSTETLDRPGPCWSVTRAGAECGRLTSHIETPELSPSPVLLRAGNRELRTALVLPRDEVRPTGPLPVLMAPYGGPHHREVDARHNSYLQNQWFADQGYAVVVADGRGTGARGPAWDRAVAGDLASPALEDQVDALHAVAERFPGELDLGRVAIRGWSFGGFLAALAVLRRPDVFHAAIAGAPVTDWRLYDTHYTERYLGTPEKQPDCYRASSLIDDAPSLDRPLMIIHGLADDNVVFAHAAALSSALMAAGRPHTVLPLSGVTHLPTDEVVAENLMLLEIDFLKASLG